MRLMHHAFCALAALVTLLCVFTFQCLSDLKKTALDSIEDWRRAYERDGDYGWATLVQVHESLQQIYRQEGVAWDYAQYPSPPRQRPAEQDRYVVPLGDSKLSSSGNSALKETSLKLYCDRAIDHLRAKEPVLSTILWKNPQIDMAPLREDLAEFWTNKPGGTYNFSSGSARIAGNLSVARLDYAVSHEVFWLRLKLGFGFLLAQLAAFGLAGHSAYSDLRLHRT